LKISQNLFADAREKQDILEVTSQCGMTGILNSDLNLSKAPFL